MLHELAFLDWHTGSVGASRAGYAEALQIAREVDDRFSIRQQLHGLAVLDAEAGNLAEALRIARELGDLAAEADELSDLANLFRLLGQMREARSYLQESLALSQRIDDPYLTGMAHMFLGCLDEQEGRTADAIADYRAALEYLDPLQSSSAEEAYQAQRVLGMEP
jgi:tetratricopeptide (TPR) repeat protein